MPTYGYRCSRGHKFEVMQRMTEDSLTACPDDGAPVTRIFLPVGIIFKGQGFYKTDSRDGSSDGADGKAAASTKDAKATKDTKDSKESKDSKDSKDTKSSSDKKDTPTAASTESKDTGSSPAPGPKTETTSS